MAKVPSQRPPGDAAAPPGAQAMTCMHPASPTVPGQPACSYPIHTDSRERFATWK